MAKFVVVKEAPAELKKGEYVIDTPNFLAEIALHKPKAPRNGLTGPYQLRMILDTIAQNYDPENMSAYSVKVHKYEGRPYSNDQELNAILVDALKKEYPAVFLKYLENKLRNRPNGTQLVYLVDTGVPGTYEMFARNGFNDEKPEAVSTPTKEKKIVGKPAVTKEQAEQLKQDS